jgi:2-iminoacetate synthase
MTMSESEFLSLISEESDKRIEEIAIRAKTMTEMRFGRVKSIYVPLYLSNICHNDCTYCGFSMRNKVKRKSLTEREVESELTYLYARGYRSILLVSAERKNFQDIEYLCHAVEIAKVIGFQSISVEFGAVNFEQAKKLNNAGAENFVLYQETFDEEVYKKVHTTGLKSDYHNRLDGVERSIRAGFKHVTLGFLAGLSDHKSEALSLFRFYNNIRRSHFGVQFSLSIPRLNSASGATLGEYPMSDLIFTKILCAFRLAFPEMPILLSTRERAVLRDSLVGICITNISCESKTTPGGYETPSNELEQFSTHDSRSLRETVESITKNGFEVVFKDWEVDLSDGRATYVSTK